MCTRGRGRGHGLHERHPLALVVGLRLLLGSHAITGRLVQLELAVLDQRLLQLDAVVEVVFDGALGAPGDENELLDTRLQELDAQAYTGKTTADYKDFAALSSLRRSFFHCYLYCCLLAREQPVGFRIRRALPGPTFSKGDDDIDQHDRQRRHDRRQYPKRRAK